MKIQTLVMAVALAAGTAFAAGSYDSGKAAATDTTTSATASASTTTTDTKTTKKTTKKTAKKQHHKHHAAAHHHHHSTQAMGAGAGSPQTDLNDRSRQARMDEAYQRWLSMQRK